VAVASALADWCQRRITSFSIATAIAGDSLIGACVIPWSPNRTPLVRGLIIRGNWLEGNAHIEVSDRSTDFASVKDVIVEANTIDNADTEFVQQGSLDGLYVPPSTFDVRKFRGS
jgi:hypothetical protein